MPLSRLPAVPRLLKRRPKPGSGDFSWDYDEYVPGNALSLYVRGRELYPAMTEAIEAAKHSVHLETYIFDGDNASRAFTELLAKKAREGVRVRLIYDSVGSIDMDPIFETRMRNAGVQILEYHPVAPWRTRWAWNRRDHRKILVCDGRVGFVGGMNISDENSPAELGGGDWRDAHLRVEGPAAYDLDRLFRAVWYPETGRWFESVGDPNAHRGAARVKVAANQELLKRFVIREGYVNALRAAREEVSIANAYFIPDWRIRRALAQAAARGVRVRVMVPGNSDSAAVWHAMRGQYEYMLSHGVRIYEWQGPMLHAKAVVVDRTWCSVGTYNLDHRSLRHNLEVNLNVMDRALAEDVAAHFETGLAGSREITRDEWRRRPWTEHVQERFWSLFDYLF
ncbi:MAG: phosphatidylserine/phosphatidylglycerophosphate/cardiolipin synthase family protein [Elusimicrobiota bacterium]